MDKCPKCGGNVKVLERSLQYWGGVHCIAVEENCHSVQQLKQAIVLLDRCHDLLSDRKLKMDVSCFIVQVTTACV